MSIMTPVEWDALYLRVFGDLERKLIDERTKRQYHHSPEARARASQNVKDKRIRFGKSWGEIQRPHFDAHINPADMKFSTLIKYYFNGQFTGFNWVFPIDTYHTIRE